MKLENRPFLRVGPRKGACLFLHGLGGGIYELEPLAGQIHEDGFTVQAIAYPGHDRPGPRMPPSRWQDWYDHAQRSFEALARGHGPVSVVGFSTGCPLALHLAARHPVERLVLLSPYIRIRHAWYFGARLEVYVRALGWLLREVPRRRLSIRDPVTRALAEEVSSFRTFNLAAVASAMDLIELVKTELEVIRAPTLILQSSGDSVVDPAGAEYLRCHLTSAPRELRWLHRSDHGIALDHDRDEVGARVRAFLGAPAPGQEPQPQL